MDRNLVEIRYVYEDKPRGTGGPLSLLREFPVNDSVILINGDLITGFGVADVLQCHRRDDNAISISVHTHSHNIPFGCVRTEGNKVISLIEKPSHQETINTGVYVISPELLQAVPNDFYPITNLIEHALAEQKKVGVFDIESWIDVGQPDQLAEARGHVQ